MEIICNVKSTEEFSSLNYIVSTHMISSILSGCAQAIHNWKENDTCNENNIAKRIFAHVTNAA